MIVAVTGASGHLGINLTHELIERGYTVRTVVHRNHDNLANLPVEQISADILDTNSLVAAFTGVKIVFHLAGRVSIVHKDHKSVEAINIQGVKNVIQACQKCRVQRLVHVSSIHAFDQIPLEKELDETRPLVPFDRKHTPYDRSKAEGERAVLVAIEKGLDAVILNPTGVIGPYDYQPSHFGASLLAIARGDLPVNVNAGFDWVDVRDVANGLLAAAEKGKSGAKYLLSGHWADMQLVAKMANQFTGRKRSPILLPLWIAKLSAPLAMGFYGITGQRPLFTGIAMKALESNKMISHAKASRELSYTPRPFQETIYDTLEWFRQNGYFKGVINASP